MAEKGTTSQTTSEAYLTKLCEKSFLSLWSHANVFTDKKQRGSGDGKELCDLLVVCGDDIIIFSDKAISWPQDHGLDVAWSRWARKAIEKSADQVRGAARWIEQFPKRIFLDRKCTIPFPVAFPSSNRKRVHGIVVAIGSEAASRDHFGGDSGSLLIYPFIKGNAAWRSESVIPFATGDLNDGNFFIHVFDEVSLDIVMRETDTIRDFVDYLTSKAAFVRSGKLLAAAGEEEILAYYLSHADDQGNHAFTGPANNILGKKEGLAFDVGIYESLRLNPLYIAKKLADQPSYVWDDIINLFLPDILGGTIIFSKGKSLDFAEAELCVRHMALVPRLRRRMMGELILDALSRSVGTRRFTKLMIPEDRNDKTAFFFMLLAKDEGADYELYRRLRRHIMETYALLITRDFPHLDRVVGIGSEPPPLDRIGSSQDLVLVENIEWSEEALVELEEKRVILNLMMPGNVLQSSFKASEYPNR